MPQWPPLHVASPYAGAGHWMSQFPQWSGSISYETHPTIGQTIQGTPKQFTSHSPW
jgi:hypothetical protein